MSALPLLDPDLLHMIGVSRPLERDRGGQGPPTRLDLGIILGNSRVGLEDNIFYRNKVLATNEPLAQRTVRLATELQREVATPDEGRAMLGVANS